MRRAILILVILAIVGLLAAGLLVYLNRDSGDKMLARATVALRADQAAEALRLARAYVDEHPDKWRGYYIQGLAYTRMGRYEAAQRVLGQARELAPKEASVIVALAQTHSLPAARLFDQAAGPQRRANLEAGLEQLGQANTVLTQAKIEDPIQRLPLGQMIASNTAQMANSYSLIADGLAEDARIAAAGGAEQQAAELQADSDAAQERAQAHAAKAIDLLCAFLAEAEPVRVKLTDQRQRKSLLENMDVACKDLLNLGLDFEDQSRWQRVRDTLVGLREVSPVAAMQAAMHDLALASFPDAASRRRALSDAALEADAMVKPLSDRPTDRRELLLARARLALALRDPSTAESICKSILEEIPTQPDAKLLYAQALVQRGQYAQAEKLLFVLKASHPRSVDVASAYAWAAHGAGKLALAQNAMRDVVGLDPAHAGARRYLVKKYLREGLHNQAFAQAKEYHRNCTDDPLALALLVQAAIPANQLSDATAALDSALQSYPNRADMMVTAAEGYDRLGDQAKSQQAARQAAQSTPETPGERIAQAKAMILIGQYAQAEKIVTAELADDPDGATAHFAIARLYSATGRDMQAIEHYRRASTSNPLDYDYALALAKALIRVGDHQHCRQVLAAMPAGDPAVQLLGLQLRLLAGEPISPADAMSQAGQGGQAATSVALAFLQNGKPQQCLDVCTAELKKDPRSTSLRLLAGQACLKMGQLDKCLAHLQAALIEDPARLDIYIRLAHVLARQGKTDGLADTLSKLPGAREDLANLAAGWLLNRQGKHAAAAAVYRNLIRRPDMPEPTRLRAKLLLAKELAIIGRLASALTELDDLTAEGPWRHEAMLAKADLLAKQSKHDESAAILARLRNEAKEVDNAALLERIAVALLQAKRLEPALAVCNEILALGGNDHRGHLLKGQIHRAAGQLAEATECYNKAIDALPGDLTAYRSLANVLDGRHLPTDALAALDRMASLGKVARAVALLNRAELLARWGLADQALETIKTLDQLENTHSPALRLAIGELLAQLARGDLAAAQLRRVPRHTDEYAAAQVALARLAATADEKVSLLRALDAERSGDDRILAETMKILADSGKPGDAVKSFEAFVQAHCADRPWPEAAADVALQAMVATDQQQPAAHLAAVLYEQTRRPKWRQLAILLSDKPSEADADKDVVIALIALAGAVTSEDEAATKKQLAAVDSILASGAVTIPPDYAILLALAGRTNAQASDTLKKMSAAGRISGLTRLVADALSADSPGPAGRIQAASCLRAALAIDLGLPKLAHNAAMKLLSDNPRCQWAALLALRAGADETTRKKILATLQPPASPVGHIVRARDESQKGNHAQAAEAYRLAANASDDADLRLQQAIALEQAGQDQEALKLYRELIAHPAAGIAAHAANNAACIIGRLSQTDTDQLKQAHAWASAAVKAAPNMPALRETKGWIALLLGRNEEACLELRRALKGLPDSAELHEHLAAAEAAVGNKLLADWHRQAARALSAQGKG